VAETKAEKGMAIVRRLVGDGAGAVRLPRQFGEMVVEHLFGAVWSDPTLAVEERSLITNAVLVALGRENEQRIHFRGARNLGISRERLVALITHVGHYAGYPVAVSAFQVLDEVWPEGPKA
jgi:alkylhydroperoxidase/carboxymuconolactone decarboxylase family protein YurZ